MIGYVLVFTHRCRNPKFMEKKKVIPSLVPKLYGEKESDSKAGPIIAEMRTDFRPWCLHFQPLERRGLNKYFSSLLKFIAI